MRNEVPEDFVDLVSCLREEDAEFVIVGAHALAAHGVPRATGDLDVLVRPTIANAERVYRALVRFGAPVQAHGLGPTDFSTAGNVYQMGLPPFRIDIGRRSRPSTSTMRSPKASKAGSGASR